MIKSKNHPLEGGTPGISAATSTSNASEVYDDVPANLLQVIDIYQYWRQ